MPSLAELLGYIVQPLGGPMLPMLPKSQSNATAGGIPAVPGPKGPPLSSPAELMNALTAIGNARSEAELRKAQAEQAKALADYLRDAANDKPPEGFGQRSAVSVAPQPAAPAAWGSLGGPDVASGPTSFSPVPNKSNFVSGLRRLTDLGVDPEVAAGAVSYMDRNENGYNPLAVNPTSGALGRAQWLGPRKTALVSQYGAQPGDEQQADFMAGELLGPERRTLNALLSAKTAKEGYDIWGTHYERPGSAALAKAGVGGALRGRPTNQIDQQWAQSGQPTAYTPVVEGPSLSPTLANALANVAQPALAAGPIPGYPTISNTARGQADREYITGRMVPQPPGSMSLAPGMPVAPQPQSRFSAEDMAWAQRQDRRNAIMGKRNPAAVEQALEMGPGGKLSLEYQGDLERTKAIARMYPELFKDTQLKLLDAGINIAAAERKVIEDRISKAQEQEQAATLARESKAQEQAGAAQLDMVPVTVRLRDGGIEERMVRRSDLAASVASQPTGGAISQAAPSQQMFPDGAVIVGKPVGVGQIPSDYRLVTPPGGGAPQLELISGSPTAEAEKAKTVTRQASANIMVRSIDDALSLSKWHTTGAAGAILKNLPGSPADNLSATLDTIDANIAFGQLQQMRNESKSGGALGAIAVPELVLLKATLGSVRQSQGKDQFERNLKRLRNQYQDVVNGFNGADKMTPEQRAEAIARRHSGDDESPTITTPYGTIRQVR